MVLKGKVAFSPVVAVVALVCLIAAVTLAVGCGKSETPAAPAGGESMTMPGNEGEKVTATKPEEAMAKMNAEGAKGAETLTAEVASETMPADFPTDLPLYEGAKATYTRVATDKGTSFTAALDTADAAQKVVDFYTKALPEKGYTIAMTMDVPGGKMLHFSKDEKTTGAVTITSEAGKTKAALTVMLAK
jgi:hypothetical protein